MKRCYKCKQEKPLTEFARSKAERDGLFGWCRPCHAENRKRYKKPPLDAVGKAKRYRKWREWADKNQESIKERKRKYGQENREKIAVYMKPRSAARRAKKIRAQPGWADPEEIKKFYTEATILTRLTGVKHHVDHIVPLKNSRVCGLHTPANLRVVTEEFNLKKGNKFRG